MEKLLKKHKQSQSSPCLVPWKAVDSWWKQQSMKESIRETNVF